MSASRLLRAATCAIFIVVSCLLFVHCEGEEVGKILSATLQASTDTRDACGRTQASREEFSWNDIKPSDGLEWHDCYFERQCARLIVPLNYSEPSDRTAVIAIARKQAKISSDSPKYRGPVLINPGGPGGSGVDMAISRGDLLSEIVGPEFDILGFDPRGVGRSTPRASFFKTAAERALWKASEGVLASIVGEGVSRCWARSQIFGQLAVEADDGYLNHINTENTARDMLQIVESHGRKKINYWGFSYGSVLGSTFASIFPDNIERLVIDGVVDAENYYATLSSNSILDTDKVMQSFYDGCAAAGPEACAFYAPTASEIEQKLDGLYESLRKRPMYVRTPTTYGLVDYARLRATIFRTLYSPFAKFRTLAQGLADLASGNATAIYQMSDDTPFKCSCDSEISETKGEASVTIWCNDGRQISDSLEDAQEFYDGLLANVSSWGEIWASVHIGCTGWPKNHFQGPFAGNTSHPILLIGNTADPVTPLWSANKMSTGFKDAVVLTQDSAGHCSISGPSICTQKYVRAYFLNGTLPEPGTVCPVIGTPFTIPRLAEDDQAYFASEISSDDEELWKAVHALIDTFIPHMPPVHWSVARTTLAATSQDARRVKLILISIKYPQYFSWKEKEEMEETVIFGEVV